MPDYQLSVDVLGVDTLKAAMSQASGICMKILKQTLDKTAIELEATARANAPHKKGGLRDSLHTDLAKEIGNNIEAKVATGSKIEYARAQEYGTVGMAINSRSKYGKPFTYIGNIQPKFYMKRARETIYPKFSNYMSEAVRLIISNLSGKGAI